MYINIRQDSCQSITKQQNK